MTLEQLRVFVAVAEHLHMTRAAKALNMTQSAASAAVAALEARHGARLFDRVGRGLALSEAGRAFLPAARAVLTSAEAAAQTLDDLAGLRRGALAVAASQTVASYWLPARLARFALAYPGVKTRLTVGNTAQAAALVAQGACALAVVEGVVDSPVLAGRKVGGDRVAVYASPAHLLAHTPVTAPALQQAAWVQREPGSGTRAAAERALQARGVDPAALRVALELPSNEAVLTAVADGQAVAAVSELAARPHVEAGRVVALPFDLGARDFVLLSHKERGLSAAAGAFVASLSATGLDRPARRKAPHL
ncbi:LysR substrate-binding domain-containing protein [Phenylobacterium sp.]|uniref:LysR substrate-binding domain-containing protein n=1 Tax=Phenylobacterium sp. TaxID=1871053 RepID=UPI0035B2F47F